MKCYDLEKFNAHMCALVWKLIKLIFFIIFRKCVETKPQIAIICWIIAPNIKTCLISHGNFFYNFSFPWKMIITHLIELA